MELKEIVLKLVGSIAPAGESHLDSKRLENLKTLCNLVEDLVTEINYVSADKDRFESSMSVMGKYADNFLNRLTEDRNYTKCELVTDEMVNWALDNIGNPEPKSGEKFDEIWNKY